MCKYPLLIYSKIKKYNEDVNNIKNKEKTIFKTILLLPINLLNNSNNK